MLKGIAASAGVSVAKVYKLETTKAVITKKENCDVDEELKNLMQHLKKQ
jgi:phosphotransferase system enzyme I (PtsI)